ncbi:RNA polymerase factor sigma-54 [Exiguobacterium sp. B2(2022)]|uniref:RNA polymerase factor sigma-54 n=1 Tax=Exiguobacterium sp. B2(2022) TaxID=2992755 RepID=UPI00237BB5BE|nr:Fis family transcriptional regulator [Exiguobacterium sp. B2(2022)]MDE0564258.1 Fis family transcriptional regulator [Exiguobacterium sp. B2(2022)]
MQRQEQKQVQQQQMTQDLVQRLPVLEADRLALSFRLARLARHNPNIQVGSGDLGWVADAASAFEEKLFTQIREGSGSESEKELRRQLVLLLDHRGLLPDTNEVLAERCGVDVTQIEQARQALLFLEPTGIGARTERECQYRHAIEHEDPRVVDVFDAIESGVSQKQMASVLAISEEELARLERMVVTLPKRPLLYEETGHVFPEVEVRYEDGKLVTTWLNLELDATKVGNDREAKWWMTSLAMRNETLREIWAVIASRQTEWLKGELVLNPLTRRTVAQQIGKHESTVGRAIQGKFAKTEGGIMEWKHFFVRSTSHGHSPFMIKRTLAELIQREKAPQSDQALADELARYGYPVTRRTVTNYREELGFGNSRERERQLWKG